MSALVTPLRGRRLSRRVCTLLAALMAAHLPLADATAAADGVRLPHARATPAATGSAAADEAKVTLGADWLQQVMITALAEQNVETAGATLQLAQPSSLMVPADAVIGVERVSYQRSSRRFTAVFAVTSRGAVRRVTAAGRLLQNSAVPVTSRRLAAGEVIGPEDLQWQPVGGQRLPANVILDPNTAMGMAPRRTLAAGTPLTTADVKRPTIIARGALVTLVLSTPGMMLTARGRALEAGAVGDTIRVANDHTRTTVAGIVLPSGQVSVGDAPLPPR